MTLTELQAQHDNALNAADAVLSACERQRRTPTSSEQTILDRPKHTQSQLNTAKAATTRTIDDARAFIAAQPRERVITESRFTNGEPMLPKKFSRDYFESFYSWLSRGVNGGPLSAALYEGSDPAGGYAIPIKVDDQIVPLAPQSSAIRRLATVIPTTSDIKTPQVMARGEVSAKSETSGFAVAVPTLGQFVLSAFAAGVEVQTSMEFAQDVDLLNAFVLQDAESAFLEYEESLFISGSGNGQPQGIVSNTGAGVVEEPDTNGNLISIQGTLDILGKLKETYHDNATWVMQRATSLIIRAAQVGTDLFEPVFRRENGVDLLHGYPIAYSSQMPTAARGATPIIFGDVAKAYVIGDRGGPALRVKVVDQLAASEGLISLLIYRRSDGRVRRSEALAAYTISAS